MPHKKLFWKILKPSLSHESFAKEQINLVEKGKILKADLEIAETLNTFFENIVKNLAINEYSNFDHVINNVKDSTLTAILKYKDHPSILASQSTSTFRHPEQNYKGKCWYFCRIFMEKIRDTIN